MKPVLGLERRLMEETSGTPDDDDDFSQTAAIKTKTALAAKTKKETYEARSKKMFGNFKLGHFIGGCRT